MDQLHVYSNCVVEWVVAADEADIPRLVAEYREMTGESTDEFEEWGQEPDDSDLEIWIDPDTLDPSCPCDGAMLVIGTCEAWAEAYGPGFLCTTEY